MGKTRMLYMKCNLSIISDDFQNCIAEHILFRIRNKMGKILKKIVKVCETEI